MSSHIGAIAVASISAANSNSSESARALPKLMRIVWLIMPSVELKMCFKYLKRNFISATAITKAAGISTVLLKYFVAVSAIGLVAKNKPVISDRRILSLDEKMNWVADQIKRR